MDHRRLTGMEGEKMALEYLKGLGLQLVAKNYRCRLGEIDLIFRDQKQLIFVEVRTKTSAAFGTGFDSITLKKRNKLKMVAHNFLLHYSLQNADIRFDVISICLPRDGQPKLEHLQNAF